MVHHQLCCAGVGVAIVPEWEVRDDVKKKHLQRVLSAWTPSPIEVFALYPTRLSMTPKLNAFLRFMDGLLPA
jgi:DNA-binding transcriptional LysR family regulator